jgi:hypothetical protein
LAVEREAADPRCLQIAGGAEDHEASAKRTRLLYAGLTAVEHIHIADGHNVDRVSELCDVAHKKNVADGHTLQVNDVRESMEYRGLGTRERCGIGPKKVGT